MSEQTDTTCCFLVRSKSVGRNTVVIDRVTDLSETIFPPFSSFLSLSLSLVESRQIRENDYYSETMPARFERFRAKPGRENKKSRIVSCNDNDRPIGNFCSVERNTSC